MPNDPVKYVAFDLEFVNEAVVCAASMSSEESVPNVWYDTVNGSILESLSVSTLETFVNYLFAMTVSGYTLVTWSGVGSDFKLLAKTLPHKKGLLIQMCLNSIDIPFVSGTVLGMMMSLKSVGISLGFEAKRNSSTIPELWTTNKFEVLQHVSTDTFMTVAVLKKAIASKTLMWTTQKGHTKTWCPVELFSVRECLQMPLPSVPFVIQDTMNPKILAKWMMES
jgi:hypothetical protein